ncbi:hypothetical protein GOV11_04260 [Candidatus Woesearchaeota archaeon]|nr:hypothetical protein [Candidatus Woesearchaeota archaeon]
MKKLILIPLLLLIAGCSEDAKKPSIGESILCPIAHSMLWKAGGAVAQELQCEAPEMIVADMKIILSEKLKVCSSVSLKASLDMGILCGSILNTLIDSATATAIPPKWQCSAQNVKDKIGTLVSKVCGRF